MKWTALSIILSLIWIQSTPAQNRSANAAIAKYYFEEVVNHQRLEGLTKVFADSFLAHVLLDSTDTQKSIDDQADFLKYLFKAFPDLHYTIGDILEDGDRVALRVMFSGTHKGEFWSYPLPETI